MNPIPYFCKHVRKTNASEFKRVARECHIERVKKAADEAKRQLANAQRVASEVKDITL